ncbi:MAG: hypothetical protein E7434_06065 [Ruminococcaceae bacterium]|nr:hypothetical protein [Oscillospiraceae bacterium]
MKKIVYLLLILTFCLTGCEAKKQEETILRLTIDYETDDCVHHNIKVNFENNTIETSNATQELSNRQELLDYLESKVLPSIRSNKTDAESEDTLRVSWRIKIVTDHGSAIDNGSTPDTLPSYWQPLLNLLDG